MNATTTAAEWVSAGSAGLSAVSLIVLAMAFVDADASYFDPRPLARRTADRVLVEVRRVRDTPRELAVAAAALLMLLTASEATR